MTVADAVGTTRWANRNYFLGGETDGDVALFSPDTKRFIVVVRKGNSERNTNDYSMLLFRTSDAFRSSAPQLLLSMSSSSNRDAISHIRWLGDSRTVVFLGENPGHLPQVYSLNIRTKKLKRLTNHPTPVVAYDISNDAREIIYEAVTRTASNSTKTERNGVIITTQDPTNLFVCRCDPHQESEGTHTELFLQDVGRPSSRISSTNFLTQNLPLSLSPTGRYALLEAYVDKIPTSWSQYQDEHLRPYIMAPRRPGTWSNVRQYMLLDTTSRELAPLLDAPVSWFNNGFAWAHDGNSIVVSGVYLPLTVGDPGERTIREKQIFVAQIELPSKEIVEVTDKDLKIVKWDRATAKVLLEPGDSRKTVPPETYQKTNSTWKQVPVTSEDTEMDDPHRVTLEEDANSPPKIFASDPDGQHKVLLLDLNPGFAHLAFGKVEVVSWEATDGHAVSGGLYLPPDYIPGKRYPLVIQTHGFRKDRFWIDGPYSSAFAAQPLAAKEMIVLQVGNSDVPGEDSQYSDTPEEAPRQMAVYQGAIDYLDRRGLIDRDRVGIIGFSRTVFYAEYTLTHSKYRFSAASLADGFDGGYMNYMLWQSMSYANVNGGPPVEPSLSSWLKSSPGFQLDKVKTPVHLEYYGAGSFLGGWQWFAGLSLLRKPVDYVWLPHGTHLLMKPWDRIISLQRNVDWFAFWLRDEEDPEPAKREEYRRWEQLRTLRDSSD